MKYLYSILAVLIISLSISGLYFSGFLGGYIETEIRQDESRRLCPSGTCHVTWVWYNGDIIGDWYLDLPSATDSAKNSNLFSAKNLLRKAK